MSPSLAFEDIRPSNSFEPAPRPSSFKSFTSAKFEPSKHLAYTPPSKTLKLEDLGFEPSPLSSLASTEPFPLLSAEGVLQHRRELFRPEVFDNCLSHTYPGSAQIRAAAPRYSSFIHEFWNSPEVLKIISDNAGVDLVPVMDYEICHTNIQLGPDGLDGVRATPVEPPMASEHALAEHAKGDNGYRDDIDTDSLIVGWHEDSHPFVCVVMLSDARHMVGGETVLRKGDGTTLGVRAPQMGGAVILQGRHIWHTAAPVTNMPERITIVTSFRPRDPKLLDETTNMNVRDKSQLSELYYQWTTYRLDVLASRARGAVEALRERYEENVKKSDKDGKKGLCRLDTVSYGEMEKWAEEQIKFIQQTLYEMRPLE